jgi:hypothetical protein
MNLGTPAHKTAAHCNERDFGTFPAAIGEITPISAGVEGLRPELIDAIEDLGSSSRPVRAF